jgi:hypothetical protein
MLNRIALRRVYRFVPGLVLAALATAAVVTSRALAANEPTLVQVDGGKVRGTALNDVIVFKGIPFACRRSVRCDGVRRSQSRRGGAFSRHQNSDPIACSSPRKALPRTVST